MATDLERLVVQLSADVKGYQNALNKAMGVTNRQARSIENRFKKMNTALSASYAGLATSAAKAFALIGGAQGFRQLSDSATKIDNSLKVAGLVKRREMGDAQRAGEAEVCVSGLASQGGAK